MRVLAISHSAVAGPYREKWRLLSRRRGWKLTLAVPERWPEGGAMLEASAASFKGLQHRILGLRLAGRVGFFSFKGLDALVAELKPDLIYAEEEPYSLAALQAARAAKKNGAKFVFFSWENIRRRYRPPLNWVRGKVQSMSAAAVLGNSESVALFRAWGFEGPTALIPQYGVDTRLFRRQGPFRRNFRAGYVGRFAPEKGCDVFIRACAAAHCQAILTGRGPEEARLRELARDLGAKASFRDFVPFEKRQTIYRDMDLLVLPSRTTKKWKEQFGRVIIEAGACGVPTLGSDSGAIPEVVGKGGLIFPEGDAEALAGQLRRLAGDPRQRQSLGRLARARAVQVYEERKLAGLLGDFLESVLERGR
jgi:glycosyltransferase involved in cell wall biosynthesis